MRPVVKNPVFQFIQFELIKLRTGSSNSSVSLFRPIRGGQTELNWDWGSRTAFWASQAQEQGGNDIIGLSTELTGFPKRKEGTSSTLGRVLARPSPARSRASARWPRTRPPPEKGWFTWERGSNGPNEISAVLLDFQLHRRYPRRHGDGGQQSKGLDAQHLIATWGPCPGDLFAEALDHLA